VNEPDLEDLLPDLEGLDEQYERALLEKAHRIAQLSQHPGWAEYCDYLVRLTEGLQLRILEGKCRSFDEYKEMTGRVAGMRKAMKAPDELAAQVQALHEQAIINEEEVEFHRGG